LPSTDLAVQKETIYGTYTKAEVAAKQRARAAAENFIVTDLQEEIVKEGWS